MRVFTLFFAAILFTTACNPNQTDEIIQTNPYPNDTTQEEVYYGEAIEFAKENLDLRAVGALLEKADDAEEFEYLLNEPNGVNNLDLNGDGYVDYISVREFEDGDDEVRGFSLFSMFGPNEIQELATIIFDRDRYNNSYNYPGARVLITGNEQLYGDNQYYETNWLERSLNIVSWLFRDRDNYYQSPYYYNNYPDYYEVYDVVDVPVYRSRIDQYYPTPVFIYTNQPSVTNIKIVSPYHNKTMTKIHSKMVKPTKEQKEFVKNNPNEFVRVKNEKREKVSNKSEDKRSENRNKFENFRNEKNRRVEKDNNSGKVRKKNGQQNKPNKIERPNGKQNNPNRVERQNVKQNNPNSKNDGQNRGKGNGGGQGNGKSGGKKGKD